MSGTSTVDSSPPLRRSTRTVIPVLPFTIDAPSPMKRRRPEPAQRPEAAQSTQSTVPIVPLVAPGPPVIIHATPIQHETPPRVQDQQMDLALGGAISLRHALVYSTTNDTSPPTPASGERLGNGLARDFEDMRVKGKQMTVKQLLAKNFKNYKVRPSVTSERAEEIVYKTLNENDVPKEAILSGPPLIPPNVRMSQVYQPRKTRVQYEPYPRVSYARMAGSPPIPEQTLQGALEALVANAPEPDTIAKAAMEAAKLTSSDVQIKQELPEESADYRSPTELGLDEYASNMLNNMARQKAPHQVDPIAYPGNHLPWPVFWKQVPRYSEGDIQIYIDRVAYTPMSDVIASGKFTVPMDVSVGFMFNERALQVTLTELLTANGINLGKAQHFRMLQGLLHKAGVYIRTDYAERLHELQTEKDAGFIFKQDHKNRPPLRITSECLPLVCTHPDIYMSALGRRIHGAVLVDTSGDRPLLPGQTLLTTVFSEPLQFESRRQILILHDAEIPIEQIAHRFGCSVRSILETIGARILIERHLVEQHFDEDPSVPPESPEPSGVASSAANSSTTTASTSHSSSSSSARATSSSVLSHSNTRTVGDVMRPRSKIRRTHYVDLNKMVWKHFKDCQNAGVQINGKHLKDQAMRYAKEMGLETFRGSEGWLDAFKRRHRIDLKTMTGYPVCYESEMYDEVDKECRDEMSPTLLDHHHQNHFLPHPTGTSDDFAVSFFSSLTNFPPQMPQEPVTSSSNHLQNMINSMMTPQGAIGMNSEQAQRQQQQRQHQQQRMASNGLPSTSSGNNGMMDNRTSSDQNGGTGQGGEATIFNVMRSCQIKVNDKDVSQALDTLRTYILSNDPGALGLLLPLQERLATTSAGAISIDNAGSSSA